MGNRLKGKVAIVTGAGRGIGRGHALLLAEEGAKVVVNDLGGAVDGSGAARGPADDVVAEIKKKKGEAIASYESVASYQGAEKIIKTALDTFGRLDILVNNAGILRDRMVFNMSEEEWEAVIKVHLYGTYNMTRQACVLFRQQRSGRIICTGSTSGLGNLGQANYAAAKEGIVGFARTVARDMGRYGVTCNSIRPGAATRMTITPELEAARARREAAGIAAPTGGRLALDERPPEAVAPMVVWLCTDAAANVNGCNFGVHGGVIQLYSEPTPMRTLVKHGIWTLDELDVLAPVHLTAGLINPSPPQATK